MPHQGWCHEVLGGRLRHGEPKLPTYLQIVFSENLGMGIKKMHKTNFCNKFKNKTKLMVKLEGLIGRYPLPC